MESGHGGLQLHCLPGEHFRIRACWFFFIFFFIFYLIFPNFLLCSASVSVYILAGTTSPTLLSLGLYSEKHPQRPD